VPFHAALESILTVQVSMKSLSRPYAASEARTFAGAH